MIEIKDGWEYFECQKCGAIIGVDQKKYKEKYFVSKDQICLPKECDEKQGGCGRNSKFKRVKKEWIRETFK